MPLFRRAVPEIALDSHPAQDDMALHAAYAAAQAGDWVPVGDLLAGARGDADRRGRYVAVLGKVGLGADVAAFAADRSGAVPRLDLTTAWVDRWAAAEPESPDAALLRARSFVDRAWEVRGGGWAKSVGREAFEEFHRILAESVPLCYRAAELAPHAPTPWTVLLWAGIGLGAGRKDFDAVYAELVARDEMNVGGHQAMLAYLCEKWYGSHAEMFAFARDAAANAPVGSPLHVLPLEATAEWAMREMSKGDRKLAYHVVMYRHRDERHRAELDNALDRWFRAGPTRHATWYADLSMLAYGLYEAERHRDAKPVFEAIGPYATKFSWCWQGDEEVFLAARKKALRT